MNFGGLIAGAIGGGAKAAGDIADHNIRLRDEEAAFHRNQAAQRAQTDHASKVNLERYYAEADRKLADAPKVATLKIEEEKKARLGQVAEIDAAQHGLVQTAIAKKAGGRAYEELSPEEISKLDLTDKEKSALRTQAARNVGIINEKDAMTMEGKTDIAQLRAEVANATTAAQMQMAQERLQNALAIAAMRPQGGNGPSEKDKRNEILQNERKAIEGSNSSLQRRIKEMNEEAKDASWLAKDTVRMTPEQKEYARDWRSEKARLQARLTSNESQLDDISTAMRGLFSAQNEKHGGTSRAPSSASPADGAARPKGASPTPDAKRASMFTVLPSDAVQVGTAAGRPVYQTRDGRRFVSQGGGSQ